MYCTKDESYRTLILLLERNKVKGRTGFPRRRAAGSQARFPPLKRRRSGSGDVSAHGEVDEDEDVELDEDGDAEEDGVEEEAGQAQSPVQGPLVQVDAENLEAGQRG